MPGTLLPLTLKDLVKGSFYAQFVNAVIEMNKSLCDI